MYYNTNYLCAVCGESWEGPHRCDGWLGTTGCLSAVSRVGVTSQWVVCGIACSFVRFGYRLHDVQCMSGVAVYCSTGVLILQETRVQWVVKLILWTSRPTVVDWRVQLWSCRRGAGWSAVVSCACQLVMLLSAVFWQGRSVHKRYFSLVTNWRLKNSHQWTVLSLKGRVCFLRKVGAST